MRVIRCTCIRDAGNGELGGHKAGRGGSSREGVQGQPLKRGDHPAGLNGQARADKENVDGEDFDIIHNPPKVARGVGQWVWKTAGVDRWTLPSLTWAAFSRQCLGHQWTQELALLAPQRVAQYAGSTVAAPGQSEHQGLCGTRGHLEPGTG